MRFQVVESTQIDGHATKRYIVSYNIENIPVICEDNLIISDSHEEIVTTESLEIEVLSTKSPNFTLPITKNVERQRNWFECDQCKQGYSKLLYFGSFSSSFISSVVVYSYKPPLQVTLKAI